MSVYDWMGDALCAQTDPDLWHPEPGVNYTPAARICDACPVRAECTAHAERLAGDIGYAPRGMWAGHTMRRPSRNRAALRSEERREEIRVLVEQGDLTVQQIAERVGCHPRTVWRAVAEAREAA
ncbi:WhiB family transcriptional regulator [Streptomyces acidiscabies]|uniref:WhiB family transcriptional regulator n=1 Tax=Streptomyces acidiscabies TaxID=42234 RepID=UPI0009521790|nr:WhiB family transcriptional regulator [Streptomyces acidiscabies]